MSGIHDPPIRDVTEVVETLLYLLNRESFREPAGSREQIHDLLDENWITTSIRATYGTLDLIDEQLINTGSPPLAEMVELANLSAIVGNLMRLALAEHSDGRYRGNESHTYPDLVSFTDECESLEIKVALENNMPKGHLPKPGSHLILRYVLADRDGVYNRNERGNVVWIWEARLGQLSKKDFNVSNTAGDSGKTAVVKAVALDKLTCIYFDDRFQPYANPRPGHLHTGPRYK